MEFRKNHVYFKYKRTLANIAYRSYTEHKSVWLRELWVDIIALDTEVNIYDYQTTKDVTMEVITKAFGAKLLDLAKSHKNANKGYSKIHTRRLMVSFFEMFNKILKDADSS